ncbi:hypothetical protein LTS18_007435, partial [Coniosporium uncinatum]
MYGIYTAHGSLADKLIARIRYLLRRTALKALSSPSTTLLCKPRTLVTTTSPILRTRPQWIATPLQRRFASDEKVPMTEAATTDETVSEKPSASEAQTIAESSSQPPQQPETQTLGTSTPEAPEAPIDAAPE